MRRTRELRPHELTFSVGESANLLIEKLHGEEQKVKVQLPMPKSQKHPVTAPQPVTTERLSDEIGLLRVAMVPGAIGIESTGRRPINSYLTGECKDNRKP